MLVWTRENAWNQVWLETQFLSVDRDLVVVKTIQFESFFYSLDNNNNSVFCCHGALALVLEGGAH